MTALHLTPDFILQACIMDMEVHELGLIVAIATDLITRDAVRPLDCRNSLIDH